MMRQLDQLASLFCALTIGLAAGRIVMILVEALPRVLA